MRTEDGEPLASHQVVVPEGDYEYGGFVDLYRWLRWEADPDRRVVSEAELTARVGAWMGEHLLGPEVMAALLDEAPVTVRVLVPEPLGFLPYRPWEIAAWQQAMLGREQVGFVFDLPDTRRPPRTALNDKDARPVRVLALFSLPTGGTPLGLRRERHALQELVRQLGQGQSARAVQLRVLQYGVTRDALTAAVDDADGWDVLHVSGHGGAGVLVLEREDGSSDPLESGELVELLYPMRRRLRLAVLSACESGAATAAEMLRLLNQTRPAEQLAQQADQEASGDAADAGWPGLGRALVQRLGCAVLAMRYPVIDDFAITLTGHFYRGLFQHEQSVDVALARALPRAAPGLPSLGAPAVSLATPALLGPATGLTLQPPPGSAEQISLVMAGFPDEPERFVGRTAILTQARHALLAGSGRAGVLLHGMAGAGKTTAALELAYQTAATFTAAAWWSAKDTQWQAALADLAGELERQLNPALNPDGLPNVPHVQLVGNTATDTRLDAYLPRLTELIKQARLLIVLDNLETLLTAQGSWLDPRFGRLVTALTGHRGASRVVLTSRTIPADLDRDRVIERPVHALARDESLLLARELPHLHALAHDTEPATRTTDPQVAADRALLARTLTVVQGHPKLLELADATAANPGLLKERVTAAEAAAADRGTPLAAFLDTGHSQADPDQLLDALESWTRNTTAALPEAARLLLQLLAGAEPADRTSAVLDGNWADLWRRLNRPGDPPPIPDTLAPLTTAALIDPQPIGGSDERDRPVRYHLHPGVADTIRADTPAETRTAIDTELAAYWGAAFRFALEQEPHQATGGLVVHAALAAAPYLLRLHDWATASELLESALHRDETLGAVAAALPHLQTVADATTGTDRELIDRGVLATAVAYFDPLEGERRIRANLAEADDRGEYRVAYAAAGDLINLLAARGRLSEALAITDQKADLTHRAGLGPWTQLADDAGRLQLLVVTGDAQTTFDEVQRLRERMRDLPDQPGDNEAVNPWNVRETILDTGRMAALALGRWQDALDLNAEILDSQRRRGAGPHGLARTRFSDYGPLLRLDRLAQADQLLRACQNQYEQAGDTARVGMVLGARADLADRQGHREAAQGHTQVALRYLYVSGRPREIATGHHNLAIGQQRAAHTPAMWLPHLLAAALLRHLIGDRRLPETLRILTRKLTDPATAAVLSATIAQVQNTVEQVDGVHFGTLLGALEPDPGRQQAALDEILYTARTMPSDQAFDVQKHLDRWEPRLAAIVAAAGGDQAARDQVEQLLDRLADTEDWAALTGALRRILAGERDPETLLAGLDAVDTAITTRLLDALAGRIQLITSSQPAPSTEELISRWKPVLAGIVAATSGDQAARDQVEQLLDQLADTEAWAALTGVLRRILAGERNPEALLVGLDPTDTAITTRLLDALAGRIRLQPPSDISEEAAEHDDQ
ncbi:AAA family ATPase [Blastococcus montanus]|uniref:AAA family ATPase n=1 Tax=Blastococcus montanus TaxID=3144973 RepID=UPI00320BAE63